jgi:hypothetical protein
MMMMMMMIKMTMVMKKKKKKKKMMMMMMMMPMPCHWVPDVLRQHRCINVKDRLCNKNAGHCPTHRELIKFGDLRQVQVRVFWFI